MSSFPTGVPEPPELVNDFRSPIRASHKRSCHNALQPPSEGKRLKFSKFFRSNKSLKSMMTIRRLQILAYGEDHATSLDKIVYDALDLIQRFTGAYHETRLGNDPSAR